MCDVSSRCVPCMTLTCLLTWATISLTLQRSCASHLSMLNPRIKDRGRLEVGVGYARLHYSPLPVVWRRWPSVPQQVPVNSQGALTRDTDSSDVVLLVARQRPSPGATGFVWDRKHHQVSTSLTWLPTSHNKNAHDVTGWITGQTQVVGEGNPGTEHRFLQRTLAPDLTWPSMPAKPTFKNNPRQKTADIRHTLTRRYAADSLAPSDASQDALLKEEHILYELLDLKNLLRKQPGNRVRAWSINDMGQSPGHGHFLLSLRGSLSGHLPLDTDLPLGQQPMDTVNHHSLSADSGDGNLSPSSGTFADPLSSVSMDSFNLLDKHHLSPNLLQSPEKLGHNPQYSRFNKDFLPAPVVSRHQKYKDGGFPAVNGHFLDDNKDCHVISSKTCLADLECSCSGFYLCADGRCQLLGGVNNPADKHSWGDGPAEIHDKEDGSVDKHSWANGPADNHDWASGPEDKHDWASGPGDKHGWASGPEDKHDWVNGPVEFDLVQAAAATQGTNRQVWHNEPFDFGNAATGVDLRQQTDKMASRQTVNRGFSEAQKGVAELAGMDKSVSETFWDDSPADLSYWSPPADGTGSWDPGEKLLVGGLESVKM